MKIILDYFAILILIFMVGSAIFLFWKGAPELFLIVCSIAASIWALNRLLPGIEE